MKKKIFLNIKSFLNVSQQIKYFDELNKINSKNIVVFVSSISYYLTNKKYNFQFGSQSFSYLPSGPYTNSISLNQILEFENIKYSLINHNDEIKYFGHDDNKLFQQLKIFENSSIFGLLCFTEKYDSDSLEEKIDGLFEQLSSLIENANINEKRIIFSYEPKNLINSSISFDAKDMNYIIKNLKQKIKEKYKKHFMFAYGGNINKDNFDEIYNQEDIDALLIGRLSIDTINLKACIERNEKSK